MVPELVNLEYTYRLSAEAAKHVLQKSKRGDMMEVYKYLHGKYNVEEVSLLLDDNRVTRGQRLKIEQVMTRQQRN